MSALSARTKPYGFSLVLGAITMLLFSGCGGNSTMQGPIVSTSRQFMNLEFTVSATKAAYARGEDVPLTLTVKNVGTQTIECVVTGPVADATVMQANLLIWQESYGKGYGGAISPLSIQPDEVKTFSYIWNQTDLQGNSVAPNTYTVKAWFAPLTIGNESFTREQVQTDFASNPLQITVASR